MGGVGEVDILGEKWGVGKVGEYGWGEVEGCEDCWGGGVFLWGDLCGKDGFVWGGEGEEGGEGEGVFEGWVWGCFGVGGVRMGVVVVWWCDVRGLVFCKVWSGIGRWVVLLLVCELRFGEIFVWLVRLIILFGLS